jgi:hypothetical protein
LSIYINEWWTSQLKKIVDDPVGQWVIGVIAGIISAALCSSFVGCILMDIIVNFVVDVVIEAIKRYLPDSVTLHFRKWEGCMQVWKDGASYNGRRFCLGL